MQIWCIDMPGDRILMHIKRLKRISPQNNLFPSENWRTFNFLLHLFCLCACVQTPMWVMDNPQELVFSFYFVSPRNQTQFIRLVSKHLYLLSHLNGPREHLFCVKKIFALWKSTHCGILLSETQAFHNTLINLMFAPTHCSLRYNFYIIVKNMYSSIISLSICHILPWVSNWL